MPSGVPVSSQAMPRVISSTWSLPCRRYSSLRARDLQLAAGGRLQGVRQLCRVAVIEIQAGDGVAGLGFSGFSSMERT